MSLQVRLLEEIRTQTEITGRSKAVTLQVGLLEEVRIQTEITGVFYLGHDFILISLFDFF